MDGNRTHPGRLNSAPQTVLKTAGLTSADANRRPLEFNQEPSPIHGPSHLSTVIRQSGCHLGCQRHGSGVSIPSVKVSTPGGWR